MITMRQFRLPSQRKPAALSARQRLLCDSAMRRNQPGYETGQRPPAPPITVTYEAVPVGDQMVLPPRLLARSEQTRRAIQIARSFKQFYLAEIEYHDRKELAVALLRPVGTRRTPLTISVDPDGNVNVSSIQPVPDTPPLHVTGRALLAGAMLAALATSLVTILSLLV